MSFKLIIPVILICVGMGIMVGIHHLWHGNRERGIWFLITGIPGLIIFSFDLLAYNYINKEALFLTTGGWVSLTMLISGVYEERNKKKIGNQISLGSHNEFILWGFLGLAGLAFYILVNGWPK